MITSVVLQTMTYAEAQEWKARIGSTASQLRLLLHEGYERGVWEALGYATWTECVSELAEEYGFTERRLWQLHAANRTESLLNNCSVGAIPEGQLRPLTKLEPELQRIAWREAVETAPNGKITAAHVESVARQYVDEWATARLVFGDVGNYRVKGDTKRCEKCYQLWAAPLDYCPYCHLSPEVRVHQISKPLPLVAANHAVSDDPDYDGDEWYTPVEYIAAARKVLGSIDLDPASCAEANEVVKAQTFWAKEDNALDRPWFGQVWLNPPYSMPLIQQFVAKLIEQYEAGNVTEAIVITNNSSDTGWFHALLERYPACFPRGRVRFWRPNQGNFAARQGQTLFYLGNRVDCFCQGFADLGLIVSRV